MDIIQAPLFGQREQRTRWLFEHFSPLFAAGKVLDVGCYQAPMRRFIGTDRYTGVDFVGDPDIRLNLEQIDRLPFDDGAFDTVICIEVLEHLNNLYALASDLFRVASSHVLISLPNAWRDARMKIARGTGSIAHYGLPLKAPVDRHKWFFNIEEARKFLEHLAPPGWRCRITVTEPRRGALVRCLRRLRYAGAAYANRYGQTAWAEYSRDAASR
ncbi:MAG: class I SAM-dependent methyltransferase [Burkholderiaceae bacterium]